MAINNTLKTPKVSDAWKSALSGTKVSGTALKPQFTYGQPKAPSGGSSGLISAPASSMGAYKGVPLTSGSQQDLVAQINRIDNPMQTSVPLSTVRGTKTETTTPQSTTRGLFSDVLSSITRKAEAGSENVQKANEALTAFRQSQSDKYADIYSDPVSARVMQGRQQAVQAANAQKEAALATGVQNALTEQGQQFSALGAVAGLAQPVQVPFGTQYVDPSTGQLVGGVSGMVGGNAPDVNSLAQQVASGQISPSQADSLLGNNLGLTNQLNRAILAINPQFNRVQAEAQAGATAADIQQTGTIGGQLSKAATNATQAMQTLTNAYANLSKLQRTQVPGFNQALNRFSTVTGVGVSETQAYNTALAEARAAVSSVLSAAGNTPTFSDATASSILPDGAGPEQIASALHTIQELINQKVSSFTSSAQYGGGGTATGFDW